MKLRHILSALLISATLISANGETTKKKSSIHSKAHKEQLANVKSRMDKSVISNMLQEEIALREKENESKLSRESEIMLNDLLKEANKHIGKRYVHGAKGPSAFDCSGFSSYVYRQFGYNLSPSSRTQYTQGEKVDRKHLRKGDLVFFTSRSSKGGVGHVGIVVSANNETGEFKFIHASIKGVKISDCEGYYEGRYLGGRRIITE